MKKILVLLAIFIPFILFAQKPKNKPQTISSPINGYLINIETHNLAGKTIKLSIYNGNYKQVYRIDSVLVKSNSEIVAFKQKQKIISAIYQLAITGKQAKVDLLIDNADAVAFSLNDENILNITTENVLNKNFLEIQNMSSYEQRISALKKLQNNFPLQNALKYFTLFEIRKSLKKPSDLDGLSFRKSLLKDINLNDRAIKLMPNSYSFLNNFVNALPVDNTNYIAAADILLAKQNCDSPNFNFYVDWMFRNLELHQSQNVNDAAQYIFNQYVNSKNCLEKHNSFYNAILKKLNSFTKLPIGAYLPNFEVQTMNGEMLKFSDFKKEKINIVMFYDPLCEHCQTEVPKIGKEIEELEKETNRKIGKIAILNGSSSLWKDFVDKNNIKDWLNVTYKNGDLKTQEILDAFSNPKFYILDGDGKIIMKTYGYSFVRTQLLK